MGLQSTPICLDTFDDILCTCDCVHVQSMTNVNQIHDQIMKRIFELMISTQNLDLVNEQLLTYKFFFSYLQVCYHCL